MCAARCSMRLAGWMFDAGSCRLSRRMQLDEHSGKLRSVEL